MEKEKIEQCFDNNLAEKIRFDYDVIEKILSGYNLEEKELLEIFRNVNSNIGFFEEKINYPLQLSNLLLFELDARGISNEKVRGSSFRVEIIQQYRILNNF